MRLANFQLNAIADLMEAMSGPEQEIILKSCTGSGKTIILTHFMDEYGKSFFRKVFIWLTPGKGDLEEQSKAKMDKYIYGSHTKLLADVMTSGFDENDACFINWEKLTKRGNNALKDGERTNFLEHIRNAKNSGLSFIVIVDESHQNDTVKAADILNYFAPEKIIRCSATPKNYPKARLIDIPEADVIAEELIKKMLVINEDFPQNVQVENQIAFLLEQALNKQRELHSAFLQKGTKVNPLIIVQIPNKNEVMQDEIERWFEAQGITYENGQLAVWLSKKHQNLEDIEQNDAPQVAAIIKQAVATGWDCPRAHILVKLRDNMSETFEIQTIGRIRRMPEAKHYGSDLLDSCYLYTLDEKFTEGVKTSMGKGALDAATMKPTWNNFTCRTYKKEGSEVCTAHYIRECILDEVVLEDLRRMTAIAREHTKEFAEYISSRQSTEIRQEIRGLEKELTAMRKRGAELDAIFKKLYEDLVLGRISVEQFQMLSDGYSEEREKLAEGIPDRESAIQRLKDTVSNTDNFIAKAKRYTDITELTPELLRLFIQKIVVHEKSTKWSKKALQTIEIHYTDIGCISKDTPQGKESPRQEISA